MSNTVLKESKVRESACRTLIESEVYEGVCRTLYGSRKRSL